ncbi:hypothetical protein [Nitrospirillum sp. BR 11163]|uniref:hypothetical protein n=1 Tax=Nitrospirillum sp. BR 11163 TaxID=3104323 RepID=UPI002AFFC21C|nr:hypothetical protein [Nitrospirillum sp. BR 11163]MEA1674020.1 hypothetical protein [Nitrospirillum sp. BR 11163]
MRRYRPVTVAAALDRLTNDAALKRRYAEGTSHLPANTETAEACDCILALVERP